MGDSVSLEENFPKIAGIVSRYQKEYKNVIVVVSALAGETRRLKQIAELLKFNEQDKDKALSYGESISSWLLSAYMNQNNVPSVDMNGADLPVYTNDIAGAADIQKIDTDAIRRNLQDKVVIIPGFVGKNSHGQITTLGFDGSDTTAITVASAMKADRVCLFKDVNGIYTANPKKVPAQHYNTLSLNDMWYFARAGARVVHPKAIETAMKNNFDIHILPNFSGGEGTLLTNSVEDKDVIGVTYQENKHSESDGKITVSIVGSKVLETEKNLTDVLQSEGINFDKFDEFKSQKSFSFTLENRDQLEKCLKTAHSFYKLDDKFQLKENKNQLYFDPAIQDTAVLKITPQKSKTSGKTR